MKFKILAVATAAAFCSSLALAATPTWVDWTSTTNGTLGSTNVTLSGPAWDMVDGTGYYSNSATGWGATYGGLNPSDLIRVQGTGTFTLSFDHAVGSLYMSLVSVGQPNLAVTYQFNDPVSVVTQGANMWGYNGYTLNGTSFTGTEYNGILQLSGNFGPGHSLVFSVNQPENWHGFNVAAVPEPETYAMMLAGLGMIGFMARRRKV